MELKLLLLFLFFGFGDITFCLQGKSQNLGILGRYCYRGWDAKNGNAQYTADVNCGLHPFSRILIS